jgi:hypothetical protein
MYVCARQFFQFPVMFINNKKWRSTSWLTMFNSLFSFPTFLLFSQGEFKPSSSDSADRGRSIFRVSGHKSQLIKKNQNHDSRKLIFENFTNRDSNMSTFEVFLFCVWCLDNWSRILSGKPFNTFSMARLNTLQFRLTLTPLFTATHAFLFYTNALQIKWNVHIFNHFQIARSWRWSIGFLYT